MMESIKKSKEQIFFIIVLTAISSFPVMVNYLLDAVNLSIVLNFISGYEFGDSRAMLYGNYYLIFPAILHKLGISLQVAVQCMIWLINLTTVIVSYLCFKSIFSSDFVGMVCCTVYTLSAFRMNLLYGMAQINGTTALIFLPFVVLGLVKLCNEKEQTKAVGISTKLIGMYALLAGFSGILLSGLREFLLVSGAFLIVFLIEIKRIKVNQKWCYTIGGYLLSILLNMWFIIPILLYSNAGFTVSTWCMEGSVQQRGLPFAQLLLAFYQAGMSTEIGTTGMINVIPVGIGFALVVSCIIFIYLLIMHRVEENKRLGQIALGIGTLACIPAFYWFPWDALAKVGYGIGFFTKILEYPWYFLMLTTVCFTILAGCVCSRKSSNRLLGVLLAVTAIVLAGFTMSDLLFTRNPIRVGEIVPSFGEIPLIVQKGKYWWAFGSMEWLIVGLIHIIRAGRRRK